MSPCWTDHRADDRLRAAAAVPADLRRRLPRRAGRGAGAAGAAAGRPSWSSPSPPSSAALFMTVRNWACSAPTARPPCGSLAVDGPTYFIWGHPAGLRRDLVPDVRRAQGRRTAPARSPPQAAAVPGTAAEREAIAAGVEHTEVFPLALFALSGMMLFPASNDLITMFVALEILSLPLYLLCGLARRRRLLSPGGGAEVLPARRAVVGVLPLRRGAALRLRRLVRPVARSTPRCATGTQGSTAAAGRHGAARGRAAVQVRRGAVPLLDPGRLRRAPRPRSPPSWPPAPRSPRSAR